MPKIGTRVAAADAAFALWINGILVFGITRVLNKDASVIGVKARVTRGASRQHAIHHVNAERDVFGDLFGFSDAHQITRTIVRKQRGHFPGHFTRNFVRLSDGEATNRVTRKINFQ